MIRADINLQNTPAVTQQPAVNAAGDGGGGGNVVPQPVVPGGAGGRTPQTPASPHHSGTNNTPTNNANTLAATLRQRYRTPSRSTPTTTTTDINTTSTGVPTPSMRSLSDTKKMRFFSDTKSVSASINNENEKVDDEDKNKEKITVEQKRLELIKQRNAYFSSQSSSSSNSSIPSHLNPVNTNSTSTADISHTPPTKMSSSFINATTSSISNRRARTPHFSSKSSLLPGFFYVAKTKGSNQHTTTINESSSSNTTSSATSTATNTTTTTTEANTVCIYKSYTYTSEIVRHIGLGTIIFALERDINEEGDTWLKLDDGWILESKIDSSSHGSNFYLLPYHQDSSVFFAMKNKLYQEKGQFVQKIDKLLPRNATSNFQNSMSYIYTPATYNMNEKIRNNRFTGTSRFTQSYNTYSNNHNNFPQYRQSIRSRFSKGLSSSSFPSTFRNHRNNGIVSKKQYLQQLQNKIINLSEQMIDAQSSLLEIQSLFLDYMDDNDDDHDADNQEDDGGNDVAEPIVSINPEPEFDKETSQMGKNEVNNSSSIILNSSSSSSSSACNHDDSDNLVVGENK